MKRVLIFSTTYFPLVGGAEIAMKEVTDRLPHWQFDLICARMQPELSSREKIGNVTVHRVGIGRPIDKYLLPILGARKAVWLEQRPTRPQHLSAAMAGAASDSRRTIVWSLMASYGGFTALVYTWLRPKTKLLLTLQEGDPLDHYAKRTGVFSFLHKAIFKRANAVQAISYFLADWSVKMGFKGKPEVVPNGVDIEKFTMRISTEERRRIRQTYGYADHDVVIVTASRLSLKNAVDDMIRSLAFLPENYKLLIAGIGEDEAMLNALVEEQKVASRVTFVGKKSHDELSALLQASDIFCRPSLSEGLGNSFLESMAAGLPIIGTPVGGIPDFLIDGETGVLCQPRNPESIAAAVQRIQHEPELRDRLIRNGEALVREKYGWDCIAYKIGSLLERLGSHV